MVIVIVICICCYSLESLSAVNHCHNDSLKPVTAPLPWKLKVTMYLFLSNLLLAIPKRSRSHPLVLELSIFTAYCSFIRCSVKRVAHPKIEVVFIYSFQICMAYFFAWNRKGAFNSKSLWAVKFQNVKKTSWMQSMRLVHHKERNSYGLEWHEVDRIFISSWTGL